MPQILSNLPSWLISSLILIAFSGIHSLLASSHLKAFVKRSVPSISPYYRLLYNLIAGFGFFGAVYFIHTFPSEILMAPTSWVGYILLGMGTSLGFLSLRDYDIREFIGLRQLREKGIESKTSLHTRGMNQLVRHPLYLAISLFFWGRFFLRGDSISLVFAITMTAYSYVGAIWEERKLLKTFGEDYREYQNKTAMLIPFIF